MREDFFMEDYEKIYQRIHERKQEKFENKNQKKQKKKSALKLINRLLGVLCLILAFLIYAYKDPNANFINRLFHTNINFTVINQKMIKFSNQLTSFFSFGTKKETTTNNDDLPVAANSKFVRVSDFYYTNNNKTAYSFSSGTVLSINYEESTYQIIVRHDNSYLGIYEELDTCFVKEYDRVTSDTQLGNFETEFALYFIKDKVTYSYEDIIQNK